MRILLLLTMVFVPTFGWAKFSLFEASRKDLAVILANKVFKKYADYAIINIRNGEGKDHGQTYFVVLEKPFSTPAEKTCLMFQSRKAKTWELIGKEGDCKE